MNMNEQEFMNINEHEFMNINEKEFLIIHEHYFTTIHEYSCILMSVIKTQQEYLSSITTKWLSLQLDTKDNSWTTEQIISKM